MRFLQRYPRFLELVYGASIILLRPMRPLMKPGGRIEWLFVRTERLTKGPMFDCRMCGQCVLHSTGMTCPQTCPKNLRNGPCGGVRANGNCEVIEDMPCVWVEAWERSQRMPKYGPGILNILPPLDRRLEMTSAWVNDFSGRSDKVPVGWEE
jgi:hypothetical protein